MTEIKFTSRGKEHTMLIDDEDLPLLECISVHLDKDGYAVTNIRANQLRKINEITELNIEPKYAKGTNRVEVFTRIHRLLLGATNPKMQVDHINGNKLDNRKENLRLATNQQNQHNVGKRKNNTSGYKGVSWYRKRKKWKAAIKHNKKSIHLGYYDTPEEASRAYDKAAVEFFGEFAHLNFPGEHT